MRDSHRMKDKLDLSLDNRQLVSLGVGGLVVVGAVFVLGVVVGKNLSAGEGAAEPPNLLSILDENAATMQRVRSTFQDELTRKAPVPEPEPDPAAPDLEAVAAAPTPASAIPTPATAEPQPIVAKAAPPAAGPEVSPPTRDEPRLPRGPEEEAKVSTVPARTAEAAARAEPHAAEDDGGFTLQLSASQSRAEADRFAAKVRDRGYAPYVVAADVPGKGLWYRVRVGRFATRDEAGRYLADFRRETRFEAFVAPVQ